MLIHGVKRIFFSTGKKKIVRYARAVVITVKYMSDNGRTFFDSQLSEVISFFCRSVSCTSALCN